MELKEFIENFADQFDDTDPNEINEGTEFRELEEWSSLIALSILNMVKKSYGYNMTFDELSNCVTVESVFNLVASKVK